MPVSKLTLMRATALFTLVGLAALLAMVALSFWMLERTSASTEEVIATREMRSALVDLFSIVQDAETGQRGYLLTGEARYLEPYQEAVAQTDVGLKKLQQVMRRQPGSDEFIAELRDRHRCQDGGAGTDRRIEARRKDRRGHGHRSR